MPVCNKLNRKIPPKAIKENAVTINKNEVIQEVQKAVKIAKKKERIRTAKAT
jgi:hypothetical protein